jgi:ParB family chromosome partitioning protein
MAKGLKLNLPSADDLFTTQEERDDMKREKVQDISLAEIDPFPEHPFSVRMDDAMASMIESVRQFGILTPAIARMKGDGRYELVSGHRRHYAAEVAGLDKLPVIVRDMTRDEAICFMVDTNVQREQILPSEKAKAYKMKLDALKRQGKRTDLTSSPLGPKLRTDERIARESGESRNQVQRYIRLTELIPEILDMVDTGKIAMRPAVELSYLPAEEQTHIVEAIEAEACTPSHAQAIKLRHFSEEGRLNPDVALSIMCEEKPNQTEQFKLPRDRLSKYFKPGTPAKTIEDTIIKALEHYRARQERNRNDAR